ncbi:MAG TPA: DUF3800 domain-containing protein [Candidatus Binataceae bacterium]|nr:DUF3800 domain-containing protein [Candidatus Binataceae bacterium]
MLFRWSMEKFGGDSTRETIERLLPMLHPSGSGDRLRAVLDLEVYCDESGTDAGGRSKVIVVGGYIAPALCWREIEKHWWRVLYEEHATHYHATEAESMNPGITRTYKGWTVEKARRLTDRMVAILSSVNDDLTGMGIHVATDDWFAAADLIRPHLPETELKEFPRMLFDIPYQILAGACIKLVMECVDMQVLSVNETIAFMFEQNDFQSNALKGYAQLKGNHPKASHMGAIAFGEKKSYPALQVADLMSWSYRRMAELKHGHKTGTLHRGATELIRPHFQFRRLPRESLLNQVQQLLPQS